MSRPTEPRRVPALDLKAQYQTIRDEIEPVVRARAREPDVRARAPRSPALEAEVAAYCGAAHGDRLRVGVRRPAAAAAWPWTSGRATRSITTPYTFFATAGAIWRTGARPVFVDIEPDTYNIDPARIEAAITPRTKAIIPVHLYGQTADMDPISDDRRAARPGGARRRRAGHRRRLPRARAPARSATSRRSASTRRRTSAGSATRGMVTTDDPSSPAGWPGCGSTAWSRSTTTTRSASTRGSTPSRRPCSGSSSATSTPGPRPAARSPAATAACSPTHGLDDLVGLPVERPGNFHVYNQFVDPRPGRDPRRRSATTWRAAQIGTEIYYPIPLHLQACFASLGHKPGRLPRRRGRRARDHRPADLPRADRRGAAPTSSARSAGSSRSTPTLRWPPSGRPDRTEVGEIEAITGPARDHRGSLRALTP